MKKVSLKNEIGGILDNLQEVERPARYDGCPKEYKYQEGGFKCYVGTDVLTLEEAKKLIAQNVGRLARANTTPRSVIDKRSNNFQKVMAYIGEHRHLIPFLRFLDNFVRSHEGKSEYDAIREYKKKNQLPSELHHEGYGIYSFGPKMPYIGVFVEQLPYLPKAWVL